MELFGPQRGGERETGFADFVTNMVVLNVLNYYRDSIRDRDDLLPSESRLGTSRSEELPTAHFTWPQQPKRQSLSAVCMPTTPAPMIECKNVSTLFGSGLERRNPAFLKRKEGMRAVKVTGV